MMIDFFHSIISFDNFAQLVPLVWGSLVAGLILGVVAGLIGPFISARDLSFAVHGTSEISFAGASIALYFGLDVTHGAILGSVITAIALGIMGVNARERSAAIGVTLPFGLGLGVLFLALYKGRSSNKFGLLTGQIVAVEQTQLLSLTATAVIVVVGLLLMWRPLSFASADPEVATARGVPMTTLSILFMILLGLTTAMAVQLVGALLVLSLLITPAAAAAHITAHPLWLTIWSTLFAVFSSVGGILLSLSPGLPISPYVTTLSFLIYLICWMIGRQRSFVH